MGQLRVLISVLVISGAACELVGQVYGQKLNTAAPNDVTNVRWLQPYLGYLAAFFYSGRKWRHVVYLNTQSSVKRVW